LLLTLRVLAAASARPRFCADMPPVVARPARSHPMASVGADDVALVIAQNDSASTEFNTLIPSLPPIA
jgi:hypothetical protein